MFYLLNEKGEPVPTDNAVAVVRLLEDAERRQVARTEHNNIVVSTTFLVVQHIGPSGEPCLWETMVWQDDHWGRQERYGTLQKAIEGHQTMVARLFDGPLPKTEWGLVTKQAQAAGPSAWQRLLGPDPV
jgi:hypothetical protein